MTPTKNQPKADFGHRAHFATCADCATTLAKVVTTDTAWLRHRPIPPVVWAAEGGFEVLDGQARCHDRAACTRRVRNRARREARAARKEST
jgi:hypothetical protein